MVSMALISRMWSEENTPTVELRVSIACKLYENEDVSLGKAAEIVGTSIEEMKKNLIGAWN
jgi:predicted HTH domain antitoxin